jgi:hypothetical protein
MNLREIRGMPMTAEALGVQLSYLIPASKRTRITHPLQSKIAFTQERYVRSVWEGCPRWRRRKRAKLAAALKHAERVTNANLYPIWSTGLLAATLDRLRRESDSLGERIAELRAA